MVLEKSKLDNLLKNCVSLGAGSQGEVFLDNNTKQVYKVFHSYFFNEESCFNEYDIMKFSHIVNDTFIFPLDVIIVNNSVVGYTLPLIKGKDLTKIDPFMVSLSNLYNLVNDVYKDIKLLTENNVILYDVPYNIMYENNKLSVIDTIEYGLREVKFSENRFAFDIGIYEFLIDGYFNNFVNSNNLLKSMFMSEDVSVLEFINAFKYYVSMYVGKEVDYLKDAKSLVRKSVPKYIRG